MPKTGGNHYEKAFAGWLEDNRIKYLPVDQHKRQAFAKSKIKSFDYIFYAPDSNAYIAEIKGRKFSGKTFAAFGSLQNWVTLDDTNGLESWVKIFNNKYKGLFVFAYDLENIDVDTDGREIFEFDNRRYVFIAVAIDDYKKGATARSRKWKTVHLSAELYKNCAINPNELIGQKVIL
jgi:hypothetical protein